ncbi:homeobox protein Hox-D9 isoform 3-T3 [Liasis olivaceus]
MPCHGGNVPKMSSSGTLSNYYVDSLIGPDSEEGYGGRAGGGGGRFLQGGRPLAVPRLPSGVVAGGSDFAPCSFAPKAPAFSSWPAVPARPPPTQPSAPAPGIYPPHVPPPHLGGPGEGGRYVCSWIEPFASFRGSHAASSRDAAAGRLYGIGRPEPASAASASPAPRAAAASTSSSTPASASLCASTPPATRTEGSSPAGRAGSRGPEYTCNSSLAAAREKAAAARLGAPALAAAASNASLSPAKPASGGSRNPSPVGDLKEEKQQQLGPSALVQTFDQRFFEMKDINACGPWYFRMERDVWKSLLWAENTFAKSRSFFHLPFGFEI